MFTHEHEPAAVVLVLFGHQGSIFNVVIRSMKIIVEDGVVFNARTCRS